MEYIAGVPLTASVGNPRYSIKIAHCHHVIDPPVPISCQPYDERMEWAGNNCWRRSRGGLMSNYDYESSTSWLRTASCGANLKADFS